LLIPNETVINGRQWLNLLKQDAAKRGCQFQFNTTVKGLQAAGALWQCQSNNPALDLQQFQTVILCTGSIPKSLQALTQVQLPVAQLRHASITAPIKETLDAPDHVLIDPKHRTIIARTGQRIRVSCGHPINPKVDVQQQTQRLYQSLIDWFPGAIKLASGQTTVTEWASECAYLPDDLPAVGPTQHFNLWVNTAYGSKGWSLAPACAQLIAAQMSQTISEPQQKCLQSLSATRFNKK
jgi:D-amino-acid dehydrogenase